MAAGLTPQGFVATTVDEEVQDLNGKFLANVDGALDLAPDQPFGQVVGVFAEKYAEVMELGATVYNMLNPTAAEGQLLTNVSAISGTYPQVATYSKVAANLTLNAGTTVTAGSTAYVSGQPGNVWVLEADVTNSGGSPASVPGNLRSQSTGPFVANAGTLTGIGTPTVGWTAITNPTDAIAGLSADTDATLRARRAVEVQGQGSGDLDSIRAAVLKVAGVVQAFVFENTSMVTDSTGLPPKSFRVVVWDGPLASASNTDIAQAIWNNKDAGISAYGAQVGTATDSAGDAQTILFDRATQLTLYVSCTTTPGTLSGSGTQAIKDALKAYALATFNLGVSVIALPFKAAALVPGVNTDVTAFAFDFHSTPTNTGNLAVTGLQIATLDTSNILVNGS